MLEGSKHREKLSFTTLMPSQTRHVRDDNALYLVNNLKVTQVVMHYLNLHCTQGKCVILSLHNISLQRPHTAIGFSIKLNISSVL